MVCVSGRMYVSDTTQLDVTVVSVRAAPGG
jgi:hypothetical protein